MKFIGFCAPAILCWVATTSVYSADWQRSLEGEELQRCRDHIADVVCVVDPVAPGEDPDTRTCQDGASDYIPKFQAVYDNFPATYQRLFCHFSFIFVEKEHIGSAYAEGIHDETGAVLGAKMGVRKDLLDHDIGLAQWSNWKENTNFGPSHPDYSFDPELPVIEVSTNGRAPGLLFMLIAHEVTHVLDIVNELNKFEDCSADYGEGCFYAAPGSYSEFSWDYINYVNEASDFPWRDNLCYYSCQPDGYAPRDKALDMLRAFMPSPFISLYGSTNAMEDLAETVAFIIAEQYLDLAFRIVHDGEIFDIMEKLRSPDFAEKRAYGEAVLSGEGLKYPPLLQ